VFTYCNYGIESMKVCCGFLECSTYFVIDDLILLFCGFCRTIRNRVCFFSVYGYYFVVYAYV
jgi:hypothetical protein